MTLTGFSPPALNQNLYTSCMEHLDTVGWGYGFSFGAYGVRLGVRVNDSNLLEKLQLRIPYACRISKVQTVDRLFSVIPVIDTNTGAMRFNLYCDQNLFSLKLTISELLDRFQAFSSIAIAELSREKLFIHSGVVGWKGKAILLPGKSHSGKSTLVAELVKQGATYYSDEFAVLDKMGYVTAYAKPLSLRDPVTKKQQEIPLKTIGGIQGISRLPVTLVIFSQYKDGAVWKPKPLTLGNGLLQLLESTHSAQRAPVRAMRVLKRTVSNASIMQGFRGEACDVAPEILKEAGNYYG